MTSNPTEAEKQPLDTQVQEQLEQQKALASVITLIRQPLSLQNIFQTTATQVRHLLKADRVAVFKFDIKNDWEGEFVSEDVATGWDSVLTKKVYDHCFGEKFAVHYQQGKVQAVADIHAAGLSDCHAEILAQFQVRANLIVPLLQENVLWGLLCVHQCSDIRNWKESEIEFIRLIAEHFTVAIQQAEYFRKLESQATKLAQAAQRDKVIAQIVNKIRTPVEIDTIFQTATKDIRELIQAERVAIFRFNSDWSGNFVAESFTEGWNSLVGVQPTINDTYLQETQGGRYVSGETFTVNDIYQAQLSDCHIALLEQFQAKSFATAPIHQGDRLWGIIAAYQNSAPRIWLEDEVEIITQIGMQIGVALRHYELLFKARNQAKQQKTLTRVITRIRESLDLDTIFQTTVTEVQQMLKADRVAVFQFDAQKDWEGEFVWESVAPQWDSVVAARVYDRTFGDKFAVHYQKGRVQAVADIYAEGLSDCHQQILGQFQVRANLVVPLLKGEELWGLLCVHQCSNSRNWEQEEIEFTRQIADNLGVALKHNKTLLEAQYQAEQQKALTGVITRIRESLDLDKIFKTTVTEVRQLLKVDRVGVFHFNSANDWEGEFIYEDVADGWNSAIANKVYDHCFSENFAPLYQQGRVNAIADIYQQESKDCYIKILEQFQVRANVVAPLLKEGELWGLLCIHQCSNARNWESSEIEFIAQLAEQLGIALKQDLYVKQVQTQAVQLAEANEREKAMERQKFLAATVDKIRQSLDIKTIFKTTTQAVRELLEVERVAIYRFNSDWRGKFVADSFKDDWKPVINTQLIIQPTFSSDDDDDNLPRNETFVPISQGEKLWGLLVAYQNSQPRYWKDEEVNLLAQVGTQLGIAIQQAELLEKTKIQANEIAQALQELKQTQAQLIQGEKMAGLGQLMAGVAHEINNPVNFIFGNLTHVNGYIEDLLQVVNLHQQNYSNLPADIQSELEEFDLDFIISDLPKTLESMQVGAERIRQIVLSLRNFSRKDEADLKAVNIHEGLDSTLLILGHRLKSHGEYPGIGIIKNYGELPPVQCYPAQLNQVFMNILSNSIDALEQKSSSSEKKSEVAFNIKISTEAINDQVIIKITDNGSGIPEEIQNNIFDPFFTTKEVGKGTGLGLPICYQIIVEKHRGQIQCSSQLEKGTQFLIELPIKAEV
ncbi:histidine kinase with GAF domain [Rivularia sp. PCC 7116]|uniref:GAF domain-containing protein n=1 Tax=Rivularia sp. PCC 7116 TaxID=373994 RepID=UPI00029ECF18|nr:GAF domain-containing protein [Rivularia sp. PCC 7116]AFY57479.1 histidine kinase with GAF domain [Rivularia sp. PCC 7116]